MDRLETRELAHFLAMAGELHFGRGPRPRRPRHHRRRTAFVAAREGALPMMDITATINAFTAGKADWRRERSVQLGRAIADRLDSELDWDKGAGEDWARVLAGERVVVLICMPGPLLIVTGDIAAGVADITAGLPVITVPSINDEILECQGESLRMAFGEQGWDETGFDMACFSAGDLWYKTV